MPTAYTAGVEDGTVTEFAEFAKRCAHAFGALVDQRDDMKAEIQLPEPSTYYRDRVAQAQAKLTKYLQWSLLDAQEDLSQIRQRNLEGYRESEAKRVLQRARYLDMLAKVHQWTPPTEDHENLKRYMIDQLTESMQYGTSKHDWVDWTEEYNAATWLTYLTDEAEKDLDRYHQSWVEELQRTEDRRKWITDFLDSL